MKYATPTDFRRALVDKLTHQARREGVPVGRLQKYVAFERFLARLSREESERWVLKGGYALELRLARYGRATRDLDLNAPPPAESDMHDALQRVAELDLGDYFTFTVGLPTSRSVLAGPPLGGYRFSVEARVDGRRFDRFALDVGQGDVTVRAPDRLPGRIDLTFAGLPPLEIPVYPLEDHFAEKLHAYTTPRERPTRVKDLVDLLLLIELGLRPTHLLRRSIVATFERYARHPLPDRLPEPPHAWRGSFEQLAEEAALSTVNLEAAFAQLDAFYRDLEV